MAAGNRPLSPHLQIYRPQITSVLSISHRFSGALLAAGLFALVAWLAALASGPQAYATAVTVFAAWPVKLLLFAVSFAFFFHFANGLRHLWWDSGRGFEISQVYASGWLVVAVAVVLTLGTWAMILFGGAA